MKKYLTWYDDRIEVVEVESETAKFVIINGQRSLKHPDDGRCQHYHDTFAQARDFLRSGAKHKILVASKEIERQQARLAKIEQMEEQAAIESAIEALREDDLQYGKQNMETIGVLRGLLKGD